MRSTGETYFNDLNVSDLTIISDLGLDENDEETIRKVKGADEIEFGYMKDVVLKDTNTSFRIFSDTENLSDYQLIEGKLPKEADEIALDQQYASKYNIGDTIELLKRRSKWEKSLDRESFEVVGLFIQGSISDVNLVNRQQNRCQTAVVTEEAFDSDYYMLRVSLKTPKHRFYSDEYTINQAHKMIW